MYLHARLAHLSSYGSQGHVREHVSAAGLKPTDRAEAAGESIEIVRAYVG
jgi:hypothetical protein